MKPTDRNKQLYRDMTEEPEKYSDQELEAMMDEIDQMPDVEEAWHLLSEKLRVKNQRSLAEGKSNEESSSKHEVARADSSLFTLHSSFKKVAAILISIITISGLAFAAVHFMRNHEGKPAETEQPAATVEARTADAARQPADTTVSTQPVVFDNVTLDSILPQIARHYGYTVDFRNEQPKSLRLFFTWNPQDSIQKVTEKMNLFEQFRVVLEEQTIIIE